MIDFSDLSVSVVIPVYNGGKKFEICLQALSRCVPPPSEVIIVADGESDGSWRAAEQFDYTVIVLESNHGPAYARNCGARVAKGDILFFVDADVSVHPDVIKVVQDVFEVNPDVAAVIGSYDDEPLETNFLSQYKNLSHHYIHQHSREEASTFWGACGAIRQEIFHLAGGFDESYQQPSIEDIDLGYRLVEKGYSLHLEKRLYVTHLKYWGLLSLLTTDFFHRALPWSELMIRRSELLNDLNVTVSSRASVIAVFLVIISLMLLPLSLNMVLVVMLCCLLLLYLNFGLYQFLYLKHGLRFALKGVAWHWFYYLYGGIAYAYAYAKVKLGLDKR